MSRKPMLESYKTLSNGPVMGSAVDYIRLYVVSVKIVTDILLCVYLHFVNTSTSVLLI